MVFYEKAACVKQKILVFLPPEIQSLPFRRSQFVWAWRVGLSRARRFCAAKRTLDYPTCLAYPRFEAEWLALSPHLAISSFPTSRFLDAHGSDSFTLLLFALLVSLPGARCTLGFDTYEPALPSVPRSH